MMYVTFKNHNIKKAWEIGDKKPVLNGDLLIPDVVLTTKVDKIQADGKELDLIIVSFHNLPVAPYNKFQVWCGDFAQFIYDNLAYGSEE